MGEVGVEEHVSEHTHSNIRKRSLTSRLLSTRETHYHDDNLNDFVAHSKTYPRLLSF